jgi:flagellar protein FliS
VLAIIGELQNTLDVENGGAVADQLDDLYTYITSRLLDVALKQDVTAIEEARKLLTPIRDAWSQISTQAPVALRQDSGQAVGAP